MPQGSVGGPILFNFYCSTITSVIDEGGEIKLGAFADDHNLRKTIIPALLDNEKESCSKQVISVTEHLVEVVDKFSTTAVVFFRSERILKCKCLYGA